MKKAFVLIVMVLAMLPSLIADQRLNIKGYRIGDSKIMANDDHRIVATNNNAEIRYIGEEIGVGSDYLTSNAYFSVSLQAGQKVLRWIAYNSDPTYDDWPPTATNQFAAAVTQYVWRYDSSDTADKYIVVDFDYIKYNLSYQANGGSGVLPSSKNGIIYTNSVEISANGLSRDGYTWSGWTNSLTTTEWMGGEIVESTDLGVDWCVDGSNVVLLAKWTPNTYTVKFNPNAGSGDMLAMSLTYDMATNLTSNAFVRVGYKFDGWATEEGGDRVYKDGASVVNLASDNGAEFNLYARWAKKKYSINYHSNYGTDTVRTDDEVQYGTSVTILDGSVRIGYVFDGWARSSTGRAEIKGGSQYLIAPDDPDVLDLYAVWTPIEYTVKFDANGGKGEMDDAIVKYDDVYAIPNCGFTKAGVEFQGWATNIAIGAEFAFGDSVSNLTTKAEGIVTFYAVWSEPRYVAFNGNGADNPDAMVEDVMIFDGIETKPLVPGKFEKTGYTFDGWATNETTAAALDVAYTNCEDVVSTNLWMATGETNVFFAVWQTNSYTIVFNSNGGTGSMADQVFYYDQAQALSKCAFYSTLDFRGWATNQAGSVVFDDKATVSNLTAEANGILMLYAVWSNGDLSDAMHCTNIVWKASGDGTDWRIAIGESEGYNPSGSCVSNMVAWTGEYSKILTFKPSSQGTLSFWYKFSAGDQDNNERWLTINTDPESTLCGGTTWTNCTVRVGSDKNVEIRFEMDPNANADDYTVWIDQMTWEPDGSEEPEDPDTIKLSLQNALVNDLEADEKYASSEGGTSVKRNHAAPQVTFTAELAPEEGIVFDSWELTLGETTHYIAGNPLVLDGNSSYFSENTESNCYVRANFTWLNYQIDYKANGDHGTVTPDTNNYIYTNEVALASASPSAGYSFAGWTTNTTDEFIFEPGRVVTGADIGATTSGVVTLYANWTQNVYSVTFCYTNSEGVAESLVRSVPGTENAEPPEAAAYDSWAGHKFVGWDAIYSNVVSDVTVNALYEEDQGGGEDPGEDPEEPQYYVVTFDANGGECKEDTRNVKYGDAVGELPEATRDNYTLVGWFTADDSEVTESTVPGTNVTYYAKWGIDGLVVTGTNLTFVVKEAVLLAFDECFFVETSSELKSITASGLPTGVKFDAKTRRFSGAPTKAGIFYVTCVVKNVDGYQYSCTAIWNVGNTPSADNDNGNIGNEILAQLDNLVTGYAYELVGFTNAKAVTGLPTGLKFTKATGVISGTPTKPGKATVTFTGVNKAKSVKTVIVVDGGMHALELVAESVEPESATGKPAGGGIYAVGKKVTIKATAAKGCVFAGWCDDEGNPLIGSVDFRTASFPYVMGDRKTKLIAYFATGDEDKASLHFENVTNVTAAADGSLVLDLGACVKSLSLPKLSLTGLPSGLKYDAKTLKVSGAAKKPGVYTVKVAATNTSVKKATDDTTTTFLVTVPNFECDALPNLKPATNAYDTVRSGVVHDPAMVNCMPVDVDWTVKATGLPTGLKLVQDKTTKAYSITGVSTAKAGSYTVTFTASKKGEKNQVATITLNVEALPEWAVGTFDGGLLPTADAGNTVLGLVQGLAVTAKGKISGKLINGDGTWTLAAASFDAYDAVAGEYVATVIGKSGKMAFTNKVFVSAEPLEGSLRGLAEMLGDGVKAEAVQNLWKTTTWKSVAKNFANKKLALDVAEVEGAFTSGTLELKFASSGAVTTGGKFVTGYNEKTKRDIVYSASCSAVLIPQGGNKYVVYLYFPTKKDAKGNVTFVGYSAMVQLEWNGSTFVQLPND